MHSKRALCVNESDKRKKCVTNKQNEKQQTGSLDDVLICLPFIHCFVIVSYLSDIIDLHYVNSNRKK